MDNKGSHIIVMYYKKKHLRQHKSHAHAKFDKSSSCNAIHLDTFKQVDNPRTHACTNNVTNHHNAVRQVDNDALIHTHTHANTCMHTIYESQKGRFPIELHSLQDTLVTSGQQMNCGGIQDNQTTKLSYK